MKAFLFCLIGVLLAACTGTQQTGEEEQEPQRYLPGQVYVYECVGGYRFTAHITEDRAELILPERTAALSQVEAASGAKYAGEDVTFWSKGAEAQLETSGATYQRCRHSTVASVWEAARLKGVDFKATGNEPGWHLELVKGDSITLVADYGERKIVVPAPEPQEERNRTIYQAETEAYTLELVIEDEPCQDTMSGERFEATVTVRLDGQTYRGCGRTLRP